MKLRICSILIFLFFFTACEEFITTPVSEDESNNSKGMMKIAMDMTTAPSEVVRLEGKLYNRDGDEIYFDFKINDNLATAFVENIPSGSWILQVDAFDKNDDIIYTGKTDVTVHPGVETPVTLHLNPATGSLQIMVTWGEDPGGDEFEDNDRLSDAAPLYEYTYYHNLSVSATDDDWYAMSISADSLSIACDFSHSGGDINIDLVDKNGIILASSQSHMDKERINHIVDRLETYYIHVYLSSGNSNTYTIWWDDIWAGSR